MRLLLVTYEFPPFTAIGGIGSYMHHLAHLMASDGHHVDVVSASQSHNEVTIITGKEYTHYVIPARDAGVFRIAVLNFFNCYIKNFKVDLIESPEVGACALHIKELYPEIPLLVKLHTPGVIITKISNTYQPLLTKLRYVAGSLRMGKLDFGYWSKTDCNRFINPEYKITILADQLLSPSNSLANYVTEIWKVRQRIEIVPNPFVLNIDVLEYSIEKKENIICFVGKLTILKGMFTLAKAVKKILLEHPNYQFYFVGRDEFVSNEIPSMRKWIEVELTGVMDRVVFTGAISVKEVNEVLGKSKISVVPSLWENYPNVILEAMAAGCAVAASKKGGIPEIIENENVGLLFNPLKSYLIYRALKRLIVNEDLRKSIAQNARIFVNKMAMTNNQKIVNSYVDFLKNRDTQFNIIK
jgi:glycogen(starch) synthase